MTWRDPWPIILLGVWLALIALGLSGCVTRAELRAALWLNNGLPADRCGPSQAESPEPDLWLYGFYRKLNDEACHDLGKPPGCIEFVPFCDPRSKDWSSMYKDDLNKILDQLIPKRGKGSL